MKKQLLLFTMLLAGTSVFAYEVVDAETFEQKMAQSGAQVVDVRTLGEFDMGHLVGAENIDFKSKKFKTQCKQQLDKSQPVLVYCTSGKRSKMAAEMLDEMGFTSVYDLSGGIIEWVGAGKDVTLPSEVED